MEQLNCHHKMISGKYIYPCFNILSHFFLSSAFTSFNCSFLDAYFLTLGLEDRRILINYAPSENQVVENAEMEKMSGIKGMLKCVMNILS